MNKGMTGVALLRGKGARGRWWRAGCGGRRSEHACRETPLRAHLHHPLPIFRHFLPSFDHAVPIVGCFALQFSDFCWFFELIGTVDSRNAFRVRFKSVSSLSGWNMFGALLKAMEHGWSFELTKCLRVGATFRNQLKASQHCHCIVQCTTCKRFLVRFTSVSSLSKSIQGLGQLKARGFDSKLKISQVEANYAQSFLSTRISRAKLNFFSPTHDRDRDHD